MATFGERMIGACGILYYHVQCIYVRCDIFYYSWHNVCYFHNVLCLTLDGENVKCEIFILLVLSFIHSISLFDFFFYS